MATNKEYNTNGLVASHIYDAANIHNNEAARTPFFVFIPNADLQYLPRADFRGDIDDATLDDLIGHDALNNFEINITKSAVPQFTINPLSFDHGNEKVKFAGLPEWAEGSITVDDIVGVNTKEICLAWLYAAYNPYTKKGGRMKNYKYDCTLVEYTQDYEAIRSWTLKGCWISGVSDAEFDRATDAKRELSITLQYDRAELDTTVNTYDEVPSLAEKFGKK